MSRVIGNTVSLINSRSLRNSDYGWDHPVMDSNPIGFSFCGAGGGEGAQWEDFRALTGSLLGLRVLECQVPYGKTEIYTQMSFILFTNASLKALPK